MSKLNIALLQFKLTKFRVFIAICISESLGVKIGNFLFRLINLRASVRTATAQSVSFAWMSWGSHIWIFFNRYVTLKVTSITHLNWKEFCDQFHTNNQSNFPYKWFLSVFDLLSNCFKFFMFFQFSFKITWKEKHVNCMCVFVFNSITVVLFLISCIYGPFPWSVFSSQLSNKRTKDKSNGRHSKNSRPLKDDWFLKTKFGTNLILIYSFHR